MELRKENSIDWDVQELCGMSYLLRLLSFDMGDTCLDEDHSDQLRALDVVSAHIYGISSQVESNFTK